MPAVAGAKAPNVFLESNTQRSNDKKRENAGDRCRTQQRFADALERWPLSPQKGLLPTENFNINFSSGCFRAFTLSVDEWATLKELYGLTNEIQVDKSDDGSISYNVGE